MTLSIKNSVVILLALIALSLINKVHAVCNFAANSDLKQAINFTQALVGGNITVGDDVPNGTVVYRQSYNPTFPIPIVTCGAAGNFKYEKLFTSTPLPLTNWSTGSFAGKLYETGVPGLGVAIWSVNTTLPFTTPAVICTNVITCTSGTSAESSHWQTDIYIIKTGPVSAGSISGSNLPCYSLGTGIENVVNVIRSCYSGAVNVVAKTCTTPDVNVPMGTFNVGRTFTRVGATTPWKDASIRLTNCPRFYGTLNDGRNSFTSDNGTRGVGVFKNNSLRLKLDPNTSIINAATGVMSIKPGSGSASGVGIQMAYGNVGDTSPALVDFSNFNSYEMVNNTTTSLRLPLVARYIQTGTAVSPGKADATVTFTISYF